MIDYILFTKNEVQIGFYNKSFSNTGLDLLFGVGTKGLNKYIRKSDIDKGVVKIMTNSIDVGYGVTTPFAKKGFQ